MPAARSVIGATNPVEAAPGSIRGDFALEVTYNLVHGSDSDNTAERRDRPLVPGARRPLVLASRSPQRRAILEQLGIEFDARPADVEEDSEGDPADVVVRNARRKARRGARATPCSASTRRCTWTDTCSASRPDEHQARRYLELLLWTHARGLQRARTGPRRGRAQRRCPHGGDLSGAECAADRVVPGGRGVAGSGGRLRRPGARSGADCVDSW